MRQCFRRSISPGGHSFPWRHFPPACRMHPTPWGARHLKSVCATVAGNNIAHGIIADMTHVYAPRRIGEHLKDIVLGPGQLIVGLEGVPLVPDLLPTGLAFACVITFHRPCLRWYKSSLQHLHGVAVTRKDSVAWNAGLRYQCGEKVPIPAPAPRQAQTSRITDDSDVAEQTTPRTEHG